MQPSSSFVQHNEIFDVFLQPFSFEQKAKLHVEESSGKENRRRTCGSEAEVGMFGVRKPTLRKANLFVRFGCFIRPGESCMSWVGILFPGTQGNQRETGSRAQQLLLESGKNMIIRFSVQGNLCRGQGWTTTICKSPTNDTSGRSLRISERNFKFRCEQILDQKTNVLIW